MIRFARVFAAAFLAARAALADDGADSAIEGAPVEASASVAETRALYILEGVDVRGNERTLSRVIYGLLP